MPLKERAELLNLPSIGVDNNFAISTIQLNIASPKPRHGGKFKLLYFPIPLNLC
ncbi:MAG TPA: hypothetical protein VGO47_14475 [Chlamydiales bacterium]|jgi:hypothetical protein|nr:hypothetical protein [Chlamydiales bacterium]